MATAPKPLTLRREDFREGPAWLVRLFQLLNEWFAAGSTALARGLTRSENLRSTVKVISFTTKATASDTFPMVVKHDLGQRPTDVWVGRLRTTNSTAISSAWSFSWDLDSGGNLSVRFQGLANSTPYEARLVIE